jgi:hypothetical protein
LADYLENNFTLLGLCDENHERPVEIRIKALLASIEENPLGKVRPCDTHQIVNLLKLRKSCGLDGTPNEYLRHLPRKLLVRLTHLFNRCLLLSHFPKSWKEAKVITLQELGQDPKFPQNIYPISLLPTTGKLFKKIILK